jgi:hypothetical protein
MTKNDSAFYTMSADYEILYWDNAESETRRFYVSRNGEMRINIRKSLESEYAVIRYSDDLEEFGITNDDELREWEEKGEDYFSWENNSWFEVCSRKEGDEDLAVIVHELDEAKELVDSLYKMYGSESGMVWNAEKHDWAKSE